MLGCAFVFVGILAAAMSVPAFAQDAPPQEILTLPSLTMSDSAFLSGDESQAEPVELTAKLQLSSAGEGAQPAAILLHGSDGPASALTWHWAKVLNQAGIATLQIDSYTARGREEIYSNQGSVGEFNNIVDTFRALDRLAADPRIDPQRIAVMGFSRGGIAALYSAMTRFEARYGSPKAKLAAHLPFYPPCNFSLADEMDVRAVPIRAFHGEADVWNPLPRCRDYVDRLKGAGKDIELATYPGAHHAFDHPGSPAYQINDIAQTSRKCFRREENGILVNADTGETFSWTDSCVEMGPAVQYNSAAATAAEKAVVSFLSQLFGL